MYSQSKYIMNVNLPTKSRLYLTYNKNDSIQSIKEKLVQHTGIPLDSQILSYSGYAIQDDASIEELIEYNGSCIIDMCLDIAVNGGANHLPPLSAPDITNDGCFEVRNFPTNGGAPSYRRISKGINFKAYCRTPTCIALNDTVDIQLGMRSNAHGVCNYAEVMFELPCPACNQCIDPKDITNIFFLNCSVGVKCRIYEASSTIAYNIVAPANQYLALKEPHNVLQYHYIKFSLK